MAGLILGLFTLLICLIASMAYGAAELPFKTIYAALTAFDGSSAHLIVRTIRLPRTLIAIVVGASLAVAGSIMQGLTYNPLAAPDILGINAGAALAVVVAIFLFNDTSASIYAWFGFLGAGVAALAVYLLGSLGRNGMTPLKLTVAGAALTALLSSLTTGILVLNQRTLEEVRHWLAGSVAGRDLNLFIEVLPYIVVGLVVAIALGKQLTTLALGEDVAIGLGQQTAWVKVVAAISVVLLSGSSVAVAGPIGFIGLVVPHIVRFLVGIDYRWILPYSAIMGAILLLLADISARLIIQPQELPVGVMTALVGAPFFIYLARWKVKR
ncbi:MAG: iron ABC transporter permease [Aphanothece sp. CMT-3BRIN-NPC111]|nr:iron ABC transporter permease [Aphanothece sp. CMT-3BRIN-NPC111]